MRGATNRRKNRYHARRFLLTHLSRGATALNAEQESIFVISTHASLRGATVKSPCGSASIRFLLTRLLRGATRFSGSNVKFSHISTHAPLARRDQTSHRTALAEPISTHAPLRGATTTITINVIEHKFLLTRLCEARLKYTHCSNDSISFLLTRLCEARRYTHGTARQRSNFYSRASARRDCKQAFRSEFTSDFYSRASARRDNAKSDNHAMFCNFYSRASARRDLTSILYYGFVKISTHAPLRGATFLRGLCGCRFISTHAPLRGATLEEKKMKIREIISTHAPLRGATNSLGLQRYIWAISTHAPLRGAT